MKFWAQPLIEASNIKCSPHVLDLQLLEALGCTCRVLEGSVRTPLLVGLSAQAAKSIICVLLPLPVFGTS